MKVRNVDVTNMTVEELLANDNLMVIDRSELFDKWLLWNKSDESFLKRIKTGVLIEIIPD